MSSFTVNAIILCLVFSACSCSQDTPVHSRTSIEGGFTIDQINKISGSTVSLVNLVQNTETNKPQYISNCTGTYIGQTIPEHGGGALGVIIGAAHCTVHDDSYVYFGNNLHGEDKSSLPKLLHKIKVKITHGQYKTDKYRLPKKLSSSPRSRPRTTYIAASDIALFGFSLYANSQIGDREENITDNLSEAFKSNAGFNIKKQLKQKPSPLKIGQQFLTSGYGRSHARTPNSAGVKKITSLTGEFIDLKNGIISTKQSGTTTAIGDSGAPLFKAHSNKNDMELLGILATGNSHLRGTRSIFIHIHHHRRWILAALNILDQKNTSDLNSTDKSWFIIETH